MIKRKRGEEQILSLWWFVMLGIVGGGIVAGTFAFYSMDWDLRPVQAQAISGRIFECISENGFLKNEVFISNKEELKKFFSEECFLRDSLDIYVELFFEGERENFVFGAPSMKESCLLDLEGKSQLGKYFPKCYSRSANLLYLVDGERKIISLRVIVGIKSLGATTGEI
jgi:hypothetical protein